MEIDLGVVLTLFGGAVGSLWLNTKEQYTLATRVIVLVIGMIGALGVSEYIAVLAKPYISMLVGTFCGVLTPMAMKIVYAVSPDILEKLIRNASDKFTK